MDLEFGFKFKVFNKACNKTFKVTRIDFLDEQIYYLNKELNDEDIISFEDSILLMPTGIYDCTGREIFQGDVITYQENSFTYKKTAEVLYENGCFITKQIFNKNAEIQAQNENIDTDAFKDLLCVATLSVTKPIRVIGNIFTYKLSKNNSKIKLGV